jgi:rubrerythrin
MTHVNREALVDRLCERLAVEQSGVQIYEAILSKLDDEELAARLRRFQAQEAQHCDLLAARLDQLGAENRDTPSARLARIEGQAFLKLIDEAQTPSQLMNLLFTVELMDENAWEMLIDLGRDLDDEELVASFTAALRDEKDHLRQIRGMLAQLVRGELAAPEVDGVSGGKM